MCNIPSRLPLYALFPVILGLVFMVTPKVSLVSPIYECKDSIKDCKNPDFIGKSGDCSCFACSNKKTACTTDDSDKLALFEMESEHRRADFSRFEFSAATVDRLTSMGIIPRGSENSTGNTNTGNTNTGNRNANANMNSRPPSFTPGGAPDIPVRPRNSNTIGGRR